MGTAKITPLNIGKLRFDLTDIYSLPTDHSDTGQVADIPMFCFHISIPGRSVIVDAVAYNFEKMSETYQIPGYEPPPNLLEQLSAHSIEAEQVSDVIITHAHSDHYAALCKEMNGHHQLSFPNAQHYLNVADWHPEHFEALEQRTLRLVEQKRMLILTAGVVDLGDGMTILPMPGESPGHQILHLAGEAEGQDTYFAGDLYHHQIEFMDEAINVSWADLKEIQASKSALMKRLACEGGAVYFTHISGCYCVVKGANGKMEWQEQQQQSHLTNVAAGLQDRGSFN